MSSHENKVEVITEFLRNRAGLGRVTNVREIQMVAGEKLCEAGYRSHAYPVEREKVHAVLDDIAKTSYADDGFFLPVIVTHFWENEPGSRFVRWACNAGVVDPDAAVDAEYVKTVYHNMTAEVFAKYQNAPSAPDTPANLD